MEPHPSAQRGLSEFTTEQQKTNKQSEVTSWLTRQIPTGPSNIHFEKTSHIFLNPRFKILEFI